MAEQLHYAFKPRSTALSCAWFQRKYLFLSLPLSDEPRSYLFS